MVWEKKVTGHKKTTEEHGQRNWDHTVAFWAILLKNPISPVVEEEFNPYSHNELDNIKNLNFIFMQH